MNKKTPLDLHEQLMMTSELCPNDDCRHSLEDDHSTMDDMCCDKGAESYPSQTLDGTELWCYACRDICYWNRSRSTTVSTRVVGSWKEVA